jgi:putative transposase
MRYRRTRTQGGTYFFTVNLADRTSNLLVDHVDGLRAVVARVRNDHPFAIDAWVVLPDHLHAVWTLPQGDDDYATRRMLIKAGFSRALSSSVEAVSASRARKGERGVWQRRYWEHLVRDAGDFRRHVDYVHINPVKHGYVDRPAAWAWSSIHGYIRDGSLPQDWACDMQSGRGDYGER